jgi:signal transduction histidine kinase
MTAPPRMPKPVPGSVPVAVPVPEPGPGVIPDAPGSWSRGHRIVGFRSKVIMAFVLVAIAAAGAGSVLTWAALVYTTYFGNGLDALGPVRALLTVTSWLAEPVFRALGFSWFVILVLLSTILTLAGIVVTLALLATNKVMRAVGQVSAAARQLADGDFGTRLTVRGRDEFADLQADFNRMAVALQDHVEELRVMEGRARRFAADVSHELRTPLTTMTAVADVLEDESFALSPDAAQAARLVSTETRSLVRLVRLVEISRFDAQTAALQLDDVDLASAVAGTLHSRGWTDQVTCEVTVGLVVRVDPRRLDVILANLIANALRHGRPPVIVRARPVFDFGRRWLLVDVADHGPGLPPELIDRAFDRFWKADAARTRSEGSGLGLAIARENARLHGGSLRVRNDPGAGAVFTLRLPLD